MPEPCPDRALAVMLAVAGWVSRTTTYYIEYNAYAHGHVHMVLPIPESAADS